MPVSRRSLLKVLSSLPVALSSGLAVAHPDDHANRVSNRVSDRVALRFAVASDGHYGQPNTDFEQFHSDVIRWLNQERLQKGLDFVIFNGDLIHDEPTLLYDLKRTYQRLTMPFFVTRGNHDRVGLDVWESTWGYPTNHSFARGEYAFILGDTSNEKGEYICPDLNWLRTEFEKYSTKRGIFLFLHITPVRWTENGIECEEAIELFSKTANLKGIFHGHDHDQDGRKIRKGKSFFFDGHFGGNWGTAYKGYRIIEIMEDGSWTTYQYNPTASPIINTFSGK